MDVLNVDANSISSIQLHAKIHNKTIGNRLSYGHERKSLNKGGKELCDGNTPRLIFHHNGPFLWFSSENWANVSPCCTTSSEQQFARKICGFRISTALPHAHAAQTKDHAYICCRISVFHIRLEYGSHWPFRSNWNCMLRMDRSIIFGEWRKWLPIFISQVLEKNSTNPHSFCGKNWSASKQEQHLYPLFLLSLVHCPRSLLFLRSSPSMIFPEGFCSLSTCFLIIFLCGNHVCGCFGLRSCRLITLFILVNLHTLLSRCVDEILQLWPEELLIRRYLLTWSLGQLLHLSS